MHVFPTTKTHGARFRGFSALTWNISSDPICPDLCAAAMRASGKMQRLSKRKTGSNRKSSSEWEAGFRATLVLSHALNQCLPSIQQTCKWNHDPFPLRVYIYIYDKQTAFPLSRLLGGYIARLLRTKHEEFKTWVAHQGSGSSNYRRLILERWRRLTRATWTWLVGRLTSVVRTQGPAWNPIGSV